MSEQSDQFVKTLFGDPEQKQRDALWADLQRFLTVLLFNEYCHGKSDPTAVCNATLAAWRERIEAFTEAQVAENEKARSSTVGALLGSMIPSADSVRGGVQDQINDIEQVMRKSVLGKATE